MNKRKRISLWTERGQTRASAQVPQAGVWATSVRTAKIGVNSWVKRVLLGSIWWRLGLCLNTWPGRARTASPGLERTKKERKRKNKNPGP